MAKWPLHSVMIVGWRSILYHLRMDFAEGWRVHSPLLPKDQTVFLDVIGTLCLSAFLAEDKWPRITPLLLITASGNCRESTDTSLPRTKLTSCWYSSFQETLCQITRWLPWFSNIELTASLHGVEFIILRLEYATTICVIRFLIRINLWSIPPSN